MKSKTWAIIYLAAVILILVVTGSAVYSKDPWFHYHKPDTSKYYYGLSTGQERAQNDGILRHFDYEGIITGTSMCENFNTSEAEGLFGCAFVKTPYAGATFNEINRSLNSALSYNSSLKIVVRGLDRGKFMEDPEGLRTDLGDFPDYLCDDVIFNDVQYLYNRDIVFEDLCYSAFLWPKDKRGITSFDEYANWMTSKEGFGVNILYPNGIPATDYDHEQIALTEEEKDMILENTRKNVTQIAKDNPGITFYLFFTPYSGAWYQEQINTGRFNRHFETMRIVTEEMLQYENIKLYAFDNLTDMINDLNNYADTCHYAEWVNSMMLEYMHDGKCQLTIDNYSEYFDHMEKFYKEFDYEGVYSTQEDYEDDMSAKEKFKDELTPAW